MGRERRVRSLDAVFFETVHSVEDASVALLLRLVEPQEVPLFLGTHFREAVLLRRGPIASNQVAF